MSSRLRAGFRSLVLMAGLPWLCLPLRAAEAPPPAAAEQPASPEEPAPEEQDRKPDAAEKQAPPPKAAEPGKEEKVSLDSNLSYPVDI